MADTSERRLAAIMFTDMVGYSALAQDSEKLALELLEEHRQIVRPLLLLHHGHEIKTIGDAFMVEFGSALQAAECAVDIQNAFATRNAAATAERRFLLRIGLHLGDVVHEGDDAYGDGVNIAARIEPMAEPGGICVSEDVAHQIDRKLELPLEPLGSHRLKNIQSPITLYRIVLPWQKGMTRSGAKRWWQDRRLRRLAAAVVAAVVLTPTAVWFAKYRVPALPSPVALPIKSVAVLPLKNLSAKADQEWFSDGMTESLIAELSKIRALKVISATSVMQFKGSKMPLPEIASKLGVEAILEGSVLRVDNDVRIDARLIQAATDHALWTHEYDREMKDVLSMHREVARAVADQINVVLSPRERASLSETRPVDPAVQDALLKGRYYVSQVARDIENLRKALALFEEATRLDPRSAEAHAEVAKTYGSLGNNGLMSQAEAMHGSRDAALRALELDDGSAEAHKAICYWYFTWQHDWPAAEREMKRALDLAPNDPETHYYYAELQAVMGRYEEAIAWETRARELAPLDLRWYGYLGRYQYWARRYDDAIRSYEAVLSLDGDMVDALWGLVAVNLAQKKYDKAWQWRGKLDRADQHYRDEDRRRFAEAWRRGGWPAVWREDLAWLDRSYLSVAERSGTKAATYAYLGEKDAAFAELEVAYREHSSWLWWLNDPLFDPLRDDSRFRDLRRRVNLPEK